MRFSFLAAAFFVAGAAFFGVVVAAPPASAPVADAARHGDGDSVRALLKEGADVNASAGDGMSALHWAAHRGQLELAEMLVLAGGNVRAVTRIGHYTPLHVASKEGKAEIVGLLLESGADATVTTSVSGVTPLHLAAASGSAAAVNALIEHGADVNATEAAWGQTPLIFAASNNRVATIKALLQHGADPNVTTEVLDLKAYGQLLEAGENRRDKVLRSYRTKGQVEDDVPVTATQFQAAVLAERELIQLGKLPEKDESNGRRRFRQRMALTTKGGLTALLHAARQGHVEATHALLDGEADINQTSAGDGTSPLLMAIINAQYDLAIELIERGADPNIPAELNGVTPLWAAVNSQWQPRTRYPQPQEHGFQQATYVDLMVVLLEAGADPDARLTKHPWYMVYTGCGNRNCGLEYTQGSTAFWRAAYATDVEAMRVLVAHGADPDIPSFTPAANPPRSGTVAENKDDTPPPVQPAGPGLWPATNSDLVKTDPSGLPKSKEGDPGVYPIHAASGVGYGEGFAGNAHRHAPDAWLAAVQYLVEELGVDVNSRDYNGYNALHHAAARGDNEMIRYLVEKGGDVTAVSRSGQTTADLANGPVQRVSPFPETVALLESLGSENSNNCVSC